MKVLSQRERIDAVGTAVFVVHDSPERVLGGFLRGLEVPYPVLVDSELDAYRSWGLRRASWRATYLSPRIIGAYARRVVLHGERLPRPGSHTLQLGGDFVIDRNGRIALAHPQRAADDRAPAIKLVRELEAAAAC